MSKAYVLDCLLRVDSPLYYATREIGSLYETGDHLHNFALTYAMGLVTSDTYTYHVTEHTPRYVEHLTKVTESGSYVTPATPLRVNYMFSNLKFGSERWHEPDRDTNKNIPNYGRIKEIAPGSEFRFCVISNAPLRLPRWIRLGIWMSICEVIIQGQYAATRRTKTETYRGTLNPLDMAVGAQRFDIVPMPPNSLIKNVVYKGDWWVADNGFQIPADMAYLQHVQSEGAT